MRINKYIAHAGLASRRKAEELIKQGLVTINGQVVTELATTVKNGDRVEVSGQPIYNEETVGWHPQQFSWTFLGLVIALDYIILCYNILIRKSRKPWTTNCLKTTLPSRPY